MNEPAQSEAHPLARRLVLQTVAIAAAATSLVSLFLYVACFVLGPAAGHSFEFYFGPADKAYVEGFRIGWARGTTTRWARAEAAVFLPVTLSGPARLNILGDRELQPPTELTVLQGERALGSFMVGDRAGIYSFEVEGGKPAVFRFQAPASDRGHGIRLHRLELEPLRVASILPESRVLFQLFLGTALLTVAFILSGWSSRAASVAALMLLSVPLGVLAFYDSYAALHLTRKISLVAPLAVMGISLVLPRAMRTGATGVFALALLIRLGLAFHPSYYFKDLDVHRDATQIVADKGAPELWRNMTHYQQVFDLGRGSVQGRFVPLPYPPTFHTIAGWIPAPADDTNRVLGALIQSLTCLLVLGLSRRLFGDLLFSTGAGVLAAFFPEYLLEFLRASYPALLGHLVDITVVTLLVLHWKWMERRGAIALLALALAACMLTYNASPLYWAVFLPLVLLLSSKPPPLEGRRGLLLGSALGAFLSLGFYGPYILEVLPSLLQSGSSISTLAERWRVAFMGWDALGIPYFLTLFWATVTGVPSIQPTSARRVITAWLLFIPVISIPVFFFPEPLYYFRRLFFALPLAPLLAPHATPRRTARFVLIAVLLAWSLYRLTFFIEPFFVTHTGSLALPHGSN